MRSFRSRRRGTVLLTAMLLVSIIAISLTSFIKLSLNASNLSNRSFYSNAAMNLLDTGLDQTLWSLNNGSWTGSAGFALRSSYANQYQGTFPSSSTYYEFAGNVKGRLRIWVDVSTTTPHAVAKATITLGDGTTLEKYAEAYMQKRSYFTNGLVAKNTLTFGGNVMIDSWNSHSDTASTADDLSYAAASHNDSGKIASLSVTTQSISVGNANVYGWAAVGGNSTSSITVGSTGCLGPYGTANNTIDATRVTYDFTTSFPDSSAPDTTKLTHSYTLSAINSSTTLPDTSSGHLASSDGKYYYYVPSISLAGSDKLTISPGYEVVLTVTGTSGTTVSTDGNAEIYISPQTTISSTTYPAAKLSMYVAGDINLAGNGVANGVEGATGAPNTPSNFQLFGTRSATDAATLGQQNFQIRGNGYLSAIVYAPNANVSVNGNGDTYGAVVANQVFLNGNGNFHYDESLANFTNSSIYGLTKWRELTTPDERNAYATQLTF
jgi:hypothetical protein